MVSSKEQAEANQGPRFGLIARGRNNRGTGEEEEEL